MYRALRNGLAAALLAIGGLAVTATAAHAQPTAVKPAPIGAPSLASTGFYLLVNDRTNKCVDVPSSSHASGTRLQEWDCHGGDNQRWAPLDLGNGFAAIVSKNSGNLCMNVRDTLIVEQAVCNFSSLSQQWQQGFADPVHQVLVSRVPGNYCLGLSPNNIANGTDIAAIPCSNTNTANFWHFVA